MGSSSQDLSGCFPSSCSSLLQIIRKLNELLIAFCITVRSSGMNNDHFTVDWSVTHTKSFRFKVSNSFIFYDHKQQRQLHPHDLWLVMSAALTVPPVLTDCVSLCRLKVFEASDFGSHPLFSVAQGGVDLQQVSMAAWGQGSRGFKVLSLSQPFDLPSANKLFLMLKRCETTRMSKIRGRTQ